MKSTYFWTGHESACLPCTKLGINLHVDTHPSSQDWEVEARESVVQGPTQLQSNFKVGLDRTDPVSQDKNKPKQGQRYSSVVEL